MSSSRSLAAAAAAAVLVVALAVALVAAQPAAQPPAPAAASPAAAAGDALFAAENPRAGDAALTEQQKEELFAQWMKKYAKGYQAERVPLRFNIWKDNLEIVRQHNAGDHSFKLGMSWIADLTLEEFRRFKLGFRPDLQPPVEEDQPATLTAEGPFKAANDSLDWRTSNAVTPVRDQGNCGSCYTFSSAGALEGAMALAGSEMVPLSTQQMLDCSRKYGNAGCNGGLMTSTFSYIRANGGVCPDAAYKYTGRVGTCKTTCAKAEGSAVRSYTNIAKNEPSLMTAVTQQPVAVAVAAGNSLWQLYRNGVMDSTRCGRNLDHAVLNVGYGTDEKGKGYFIIKNSWGAQWGEEGYIRLVRGKNMCGVNDMSTIPNVALTLERKPPLTPSPAESKGKQNVPSAAATRLI